MDTNKVYEVLDNAKNAFEALSQTIREVMGQMRDMQSENEQLNSANQRLSDDNNTLRTRQHDLESELFNARKEARDNKSQLEIAQMETTETGRKLAEALEEAKKLREIILNVAASVDGIVNAKAEAKAPEVAPAAPKPEQVQTEVATQTYGSPNEGRDIRF